VLVEHFDKVNLQPMPMAEYNAMIAKCRQATRRQSRFTWCTEVIAVSILELQR